MAWMLRVQKSNNSHFKDLFHLFIGKIMKFKNLTSFVVTALGLSIGQAYATPLTETSPTGGGLPAGVSVVGGIVVDLIGTNGVRVVSQLAASGLFRGTPTITSTTIGTQTGFNASLFGGGLSSASFRVSLFDGDTASGNFDFGANSFAVDSINFGDSSSISTHVTSGTGAFIRATLGFPDDELATGWFVTSSSNLGLLFAALGDDALTFTWVDRDPGDQFYDFSAGINASLVNIGSGPTVTQPGSTVPLPGTVALLGAGLIGFALRKRK